MKNKKRFATLAVAGALVATCGISAYFTATDTMTNTFEVEDVKTDLTEPEFEDLTEEDKLVTPNETIVKDPTVTNTGDTDEFVFLSVKVPFKNIITANLDGTRNDVADTELFVWNTESAKGAINTLKGENGGKVNDGWVLIDTIVGADDVEYIYAYGTASEMTALPAGESTPTLFDSVTMCNAIEGQGLENQTVDIDVALYAIQSQDLNESGNGTKVPTEVYNIYANQWNSTDASTNNDISVIE